MCSQLCLVVVLLFCCGGAYCQSVQLLPKAVEIKSIERGVNGLVKPKVNFLISSLEKERFTKGDGFSEDMRFTSITVQGKPVTIGVSASHTGQKRYAIAVDGKRAETKDGPVESWKRDYTPFFIQLGDSNSSLPLYLRATGNPPIALRYFIPTYFEGEWAPEGTKPFRVAVYRQWAGDQDNGDSSAQLLMDLDGDTGYYFKSSSDEVRKLEEPFTILGNTYLASLAADRKTMQFSKVHAETPELTVLQMGTVAPDWSVHDLSGKSVRLSDFRGKYVFFDVWAAWCGPCVNEVPGIQKAHESYGDRVAVIGINIDRIINAPKEFSDEKKLTYTQLWADKEFNSEIARQYHIHSIPATFLVDPEGRLVSSGIRGEMLERTIAMAANPDTPEAKQFFEESRERFEAFARIDIMRVSGEKDKAIELLKSLQAKHTDPVGLAEIKRRLEYLEKS